MNFMGPDAVRSSVSVGDWAWLARANLDQG